MRSCTTLISGLLPLFIAGCSVGRTYLDKNGSVRVEREVPETVRLPKLEIYEEDGQMVVYGLAGRSMAATESIVGHVDIIVTGPDAAVIYTASTKHFPRRLPMKKSRESNFSVRFPSVPPQGSTVRVIYHPTPEHGGQAGRERH